MRRADEERCLGFLTGVWLSVAVGTAAPAAAPWPTHAPASFGRAGSTDVSRDARSLVAPERAPAAALAPLAADPDAWCARELRLLPGLGPTRAVALVRDRHARGPAGGPAAWTRVPGIGAGTADRAARAWERVRGRRLSASTPGAYTPTGP